MIVFERKPWKSSFVTVQRGRLLQVLLKCPTLKQEKQILVFGING